VAEFEKRLAARGLDVGVEAELQAAARKRGSKSL
jgi:hypothetical protein